MAIRYARFQIPAVGAGASLGETAIITSDDARQRKVTGFRTTNTTKLIHTLLMRAGFVVADVDNGLLSVLVDFLPVDQVYDGGLPITLDVRNASAAALPVNTDAIVVRYEA